MNMITMSRMCESIEHCTPTKKKEIISSTLSSLSTRDRTAMIQILSLEYNNNNIGEKKAIKWLSSKRMRSSKLKLNIVLLHWESLMT